MNEQFFFLSSKAAEEYFPSSSYVDFTTPLPNQITLPSHDHQCNPLHWSIALTDFAVEGRKRLFSKHTSFVVLCDLVRESYIRGRYSPVLRIIREESYPVTSLSIPYYIPLNTLSFNSIRIYLQTEDLQAIPITGSNSNLSCTLHLMATKD